MDDLIYPKKEPTKFVPRLLKLGIEFKTDEYISWEVEKVNYDLFNSVPKETRQKIKDAWMKGGISIEGVAKQFGVDSRVVGAIIFLNLKKETYCSMREESL